MWGIKRVLLLAVGLVVAMAVALPGVSQAVDFSGSTACVISGKAKANVQFARGSGTYTFQSFSALCTTVGTAKGSSVAAVVSLAISSNGTFSNHRCGTGHTNDSSTVVDATEIEGNGGGKVEALLDSASPDAVGLGHRIMFDWTQGVLEFEDSAITGGGHINIQPDTGGLFGGKPAPGVAIPPDETDTCATGWAVTGEVSGTTQIR